MFGAPVRHNSCDGTQFRCHPVVFVGAEPVWRCCTAGSEPAGHNSTHVPQSCGSSTRLLRTGQRCSVLPWILPGLVEWRWNSHPLLPALWPSLHLLAVSRLVPLAWHVVLVMG